MAVAAGAVCGAAFLGVGPAGASTSAVAVNFGSCLSELGQSGQAQAIPFQAPGWSGNGPLTITNGQIIFPPAFDGAMGCNV